MSALAALLNMGKKPPIKEIMVMLVTESNATLFVDQYDTPYIRYEEDGWLKTYPLKSGVVKCWLAKQVWDLMQKVPSNDATGAALNVLKAIARAKHQFPLFNRVANDDLGNIYIDMADSKWRAIKVTPDGWHIDDYPPTLFRRFTHMQPLPEPVPGGDPKEILSFVNLKDEKQKMLFVVTTVSYLIPNIPHVVTICYGPRGGGKSMAMIAMRETVDPSSLKLLRVPRAEKELVQQMFHHYLPFYDNIGRTSRSDGLPNWASDAFCRAVTGTGNSKRELYSDDDDVIYQYRRCPGLNGINIPVNRGDLLDRAVLFEHTMITKDQRLEEKELDRLMQEKIPGILGGALDAVVKALNIYEKLELRGLYRMADFTKWGYAIAEALGYGGEAFLEAYEENVKVQSIEAIKVSPLAHVLLKFMEGQVDNTWEGEPAELYMRLKETADLENVSTRQSAWPKSPNAMTRRLNELSPSLPAVGYLYESTRGVKRTIYITPYVEPDTPEPPEEDEPDVEKTEEEKGKHTDNSVKTVNTVEDEGDIDDIDDIDDNVPMFSPYKCSWCGIPLNIETGTFCNPATGEYYCRQHWMHKRRQLEEGQP